jgi:hypothetical protein
MHHGVELPFMKSIELTVWGFGSRLPPASSILSQANRNGNVIISMPQLHSNPMDKRIAVESQQSRKQLRPATPFR